MSIVQVGLVYQDVVAGVEVINCQSVKLQVNKCYYGGDIFMVLMAAIMSLMATGYNINVLFLLQVLGSVPTISVDKTDGCQMFLRFHNYLICKSLSCFITKKD